MKAEDFVVGELVRARADGLAGAVWRVESKRGEELMLRSADVRSPSSFAFAAAAEVVPVSEDRRRLDALEGVARAARRWMELWRNEGAPGHADDMASEPDWPAVEVDLVGALDDLSDAERGVPPRGGAGREPAATDLDELLRRLWAVVDRPLDREAFRRAIEFVDSGRGDPLHTPASDGSIDFGVRDAVARVLAGVDMVVRGWEALRRAWSAESDDPPRGGS